MNDRVTDRFVTQLIWERLDYHIVNKTNDIWETGINTPDYWSIAFPQPPEVIAYRKASVHLTRSIPQRNKQLLKEKLNFSGYSIQELFPRRTRRATAVNWLLSWMDEHQEELLNDGPLPSPLLAPPLDPVIGHPGDLPIS